MEVRGLPYVEMRDSMTLLQLVEHEGPSIATARSPNFPEVIHRHLLEISPAGAQFGAVKDWFVAGEFRGDIIKLWISGEDRFHVRNYGTITFECRVLLTSQEVADDPG
jgi:hypothetical protein